MKKLNEYETPETDALANDRAWLTTGHEFTDADARAFLDHACDLERRLAMCRDALMETSVFWQAVLMHFGPVHAAKQAEKEALAIRDETLKETEPK